MPQENIPLNERAGVAFGLGKQSYWPIAEYMVKPFDGSQYQKRIDAAGTDEEKNEIIRSRNISQQMANERRAYAGALLSRVGLKLADIDALDTSSDIQAAVQQANIKIGRELLIPDLLSIPSAEAVMAVKFPKKEDVKWIVLAGQGKVISFGDVRSALSMNLTNREAVDRQFADARVRLPWGEQVGDH